MLQSVSSAEAGFYKCVSIGLTDPSYNVQRVELVVKKDWEEVWETDTEVRCLMKLMSCLSCQILFSGPTYSVGDENCPVYCILLHNAI